MKKILPIVLVSFVFLFLVGVAMATQPKPPGRICIDAGGGGIYVLVVTPSASIKIWDGWQTFYSIQGAIIAGSINLPVVGAGYMEGTVFHFTFNGTYNFGGTAYFVQSEGFWDVTVKRGTEYQYVSNGGFSYTDSLSETSCTDKDILFYSQGEERSRYLPLNQ